MKNIYITILVIFSTIFSNTIEAQEFTLKDYEKKEVYIPMRDGSNLYTAVYQPKEKNKTYPILINRTPYGCFPYGEQMPNKIMYNQRLVASGYIFVYQDIRGRTMSDGEDMINLKPVYSQIDSKATDEVTDAYDTISWLLENIENNNGKAGIFGNSYKGWTALMGALSKHPALKAVQIGAPSINGYFEDFTRYGLFTLGYTPIIDWFGTPRKEKVTGPWWEFKKDYFASFENFRNKLDYDSYRFFLEKGALKNYKRLLSEDNYFWKYLKEHPNYDEARKERNTINYIKKINCPILLVGSWNDEQNLYGFLKLFEALDVKNKGETTYIVGPWSHGDYKKTDSLIYVGNRYYGKNMYDEYHEKEFKYFEHHLKGAKAHEIPKNSFFDTGKNTWTTFGKKQKTKEKTFYFSYKEQLVANEEPINDKSAYFGYISDPSKPVPYIEQDNYNLFISKSFMTDDQRFAYKRPDVLTFMTSPLSKDITVNGAGNVVLKFSTDQGDADLIVKLIDVLPMDRKPQTTDKPNLKMNGYQQMVRCGYIRGRYRDSFSNPKPFTPHEVSEVKVTLLDVYHTFKKGHRIMIQIQSSLFPLFDRNPQKYVPNIYEADDEDFTKAMHKIYIGSKITLSVTTEN